MSKALPSLRLSLEMLVGRRLWLFALVDVLVLGSALLNMLLNSGEDPQALYRQVILVPFLILGVPALANLVDVERQAGCLDLALSTASVEAYFLRRAAAVAAVLSVQGWVLIVLDWLYEERWFPLPPVMLQVAVVSVFLATLALFWAVRLRTAGGVWLASMATVVAFGPWFFFNPVPDRLYGRYNGLVLTGEAALDWFASLAALSAASLLLYLYARRRLRRPETLIS